MEFSVDSSGRLLLVRSVNARAGAARRLARQWRPVDPAKTSKNGTRRQLSALGICNMPRQTISSGAPWEQVVAYSRAVRVGAVVCVAGTTASDDSGRTVSPDNPYAQTLYILQKIEAALLQAGASRSDVVRTRMFVTDISRWQEFGRAHGEFFRGVNPASTMVEVRRLINPDHLIEIEADAVVDNAAPSS